LAKVLSIAQTAFANYRSSFFSIDIEKMNELPFPTPLSTQIFPPCASTAILQKASPSPLPLLEIRSVGETF
jgi:hypothetical protein